MNFTLRRPPEATGDVFEDYTELLLWCNELYDTLWLSEIIKAQIKKNETEVEQDEQII